MVAKLPQLKKSLKSFILEEDAKIIDKNATKIAITTSFLALNLMGNIDDVSAWGHSSHNNHNNHLFQPSDLNSDDNIVEGDKHDLRVFEREDLNNLNSSSDIDNDIDFVGEKKWGNNQDSKASDFKTPAKSVSVAHANHYNSSDRQTLC